MYSCFPQTQVLKCCVLLWLGYIEKFTEFTALFPILSLASPHWAFDTTTPPKLLSSRPQPLPCQIQWPGLSPRCIQLSRTWHSGSLPPPPNTFSPWSPGPCGFEFSSFLTGLSCLLCWLSPPSWPLNVEVLLRGLDLSPCIFSVPKWALPKFVSLALSFSLSSRHEYQLPVQHLCLDV